LDVFRNLERASSAMSVAERDGVGLMASDPRPSQRFATPSRCKSPHPLTAARAVLPLLYLVHCLVSNVIALLIGNRPQSQVVADVYLMRVLTVHLFCSERCRVYVTANDQILARVILGIVGARPPTEPWADADAST